MRKRRDVVVVPWGDEAAFARAMETNGPRLACVLLDLMPNRAGLVPAPVPFAHLARALTCEYGALLVVDEVITFRLSFGGLCEVLGVQADLGWAPEKPSLEVMVRDAWDFLARDG